MRKEELESKHLSITLGKLFSLQKSGNESIHPSQIRNAASFKMLLSLLKHHAYLLEVNDAIDCLKILSYFGLKSSNIVMVQLLNCVKDQINDLTLSHLMFMNFILKQMESTPLVDALMIALPMVLDLNLSIKLDHNNTKELCELFHFISTTPARISEKNVTNIISALTIHGDTLKVSEATSVVWSLTTMSKFHPSYEKLFNNCMHILNTKMSEVQSFNLMETTLSKMISKYQIGESIFYNEQYFNNCAKYVVENDCGFLNGMFVLNKLNKIAFVNYELLDYLDSKIISKHTNLSTCKLAGLFTLATGFSNANYKSKNWEIIKSIILENPLLNIEKYNFPWVKFSLEMASLGFYSNIVLEKVFSSEFLDSYMSRDDNLLDHLQLLNLWQSVNLTVPEYDGPQPEQRFIDTAIRYNFSRRNETFEKILGHIFGGDDYVQKNVASNYGHCLDFVISFDSDNNPIALPCAVKNYEQIPKSQVKSVAVFFSSKNCYCINYPQKLRGMFQLRYKSIEALGIPFVDIPLSMWNNLPDQEKLDYVEREIRYCLN